MNSRLYHNHPDNNYEIDLYLITGPIRVDCSIQGVNRDTTFIKEYVFHQQLVIRKYGSLGDSLQNLKYGKVT